MELMLIIFTGGSSSGVTGVEGNIFEINRLKRENQQLR